MPLKSFVLFLPLFFTLTAAAQFEEYHYFSESEISEINTPLLLDSEYFSDILTYRYPLSMQSQFLRSNRVYDLSIGSLSRTRFASQQRLKLDTQLNESLLFRLAYMEQKDLEQNINHFILELQYKLTSYLSLVGYTELKSEKKWNDVGVALLFDIQKNHQLRLYTTWIDFSFNKRSENNESDSQSPMAYGFVGRLFSDDEISFLEYYARVQSPLVRNLDTGATYTHRDSKLGVRGTKVVGLENQLIHFDVSYKYRNEGSELVGSTDRTNGLWRSRHADALLQYENSSWIFGLSQALREWQINNEKIQAQTFSPHIWYTLNSSPSKKNQLRLGYEASFHSSSGPADLRSPPDVNKDIEHRGNLRYTIHFNENSFLHFYLTADLDDASWEGGNGTFQIVF